MKRWACILPVLGFLSIVFGLSACVSTPGLPPPKYPIHVCGYFDHLSVSNQIKQAVLAYMVTISAEDLESIRFVRLPLDELELLKERCGAKFPIFDAEKIKRTDTEYRLAGTSRKGGLIDAEVTRISGDSAEAIGSYVSPGCVAVFSYELQKQNTGWKVTKSKLVRAT
jgi:hypothetical protein